MYFNFLIREGSALTHVGCFGRRKIANNTTNDFRITIIYLQNGRDDDYCFKKPLNFLDIASIPLASLHNTWATESGPMIKLIKNYIEKVNISQNYDDEFIIYKLQYENKNSFPLSRYLSKTTQKRMKYQIRKIRKEKSNTMNSKAYRFIRDL